MTHIVNDNGVDRPMTNDEIKELQALQEAVIARLEAEKQADAAKDAAKAKLAALGLTVDDLKALGL
jgi:uncharacterized small protein (DUF1192 family)